MSTLGYDAERHEVDAVVRAVLEEALGDAADLDPIALYHELTRIQRLWEAAGQRVIRALSAERGHALREAGVAQDKLRESTGLGSQQRVSQIMAAADYRDPIAIEIEGAGQ